MERFRASLRETEHTIGLSEPGVLSIIFNAVARDTAHGGHKRECILSLSGLNNDTGSHVDWAKYELQAGDRIVIEVMEDGEADSPASEQKRDTELEEKGKQDYVRKTAQELGWKIIENP